MRMTIALPRLGRIRVDVHLYSMGIYYSQAAILRAGEPVLIMDIFGSSGNIVLSSWGLGFVFDDCLVDFAAKELEL